MTLKKVFFFFFDQKYNISFLLIKKIKKEETPLHNVQLRSRQGNGLFNKELYKLNNWKKLQKLKQHLNKH